MLEKILQPQPKVETREEDKEKLPELELRELMRSEKPINQEDGTKKKIETLRPWNNYSIVILENPQQIKIFDENGLEVQDFKTPLNNTSVEINFQAIIHKAKKKYLGDNSHSKDEVLNAKNLPPLLQKRGLQIIKNQVDQGGWALGVSKIKTEKLELQRPNAHVLEGGKYIVVGNKNESPFIAFITENNAGIVQVPRNWKRIDFTSPDVPKDLEEYIKAFESLPGEYRDISNGKYTVLVTDVGINIVSKDKINDAPLFSDNLPGVEQNVITDPSNSNILYYCRSNNPKDIMRLDLSAEPNNWAPVAAELPKKYDGISNLQLDPSGNFFLFYSKDDLVIITKDTLEEVKRVPKLTQVNFDRTGRIRAVDKDGHLVIYEPNFDDLAEELDKRRVQKLAEGIKILDIFDLEASKRAQAQQTRNYGESLEYLDPLRTQYTEQFNDVLAKITTQEGVQQIRQGFNKLRDILKQQGLKANEVSFIIEGLEAPIEEKEKEFAGKAAQEALTLVKAKLASGLSIASVSEARSALDTVKASEGLLDTELRREVREVAQELDQQSLELFRQRGGEVIKDVQGILARTKTDLEGFTSKAQMDDWLEFRYPQLKSRLGSIAKDVPLEADEAYKAIVAARTELQIVASTFEDKFKREYAKVREKAVERTEATVDILEQDIAGLIERLRSKGFADRKTAEQYLATSEARKTIEAEVAALTSNSPDVAKELERALKVRISNTLTEIERGALTQVADTGQQMVLLGQTAFPKWEAKVKGKEERKVDVVFEEDSKTHGPGIKAGDILGDVALKISTSSGVKETATLYEGWHDENEWRFGLLSYRGEAIPPSYLSASEFKEVKKGYSEWSKGESSNLQKELEKQRNALKEIYAKRQKVKKREKGSKREIIAMGWEQGKGDWKKEVEKNPDELWKKEYQTQLDKYAKFCAENHVSLLRRIDKVKSEPEIEYTNGKGFIPEWQSHWVTDKQTEQNLGEMARIFKMQLDLQEGILNLKGHAGSGKDVLIKMFAAMTHRPYFAIDCTKWTTEFELSEDVMLESKDGASQTLRVPSAVLNGITTPGAIVYFNEFTAMPEQAQIFLHALMDEKRSLTLKTSSGKTIRAEKSVVLAASENPGYPGTFEPQFATKSRMVSLEIGYPPLTRKPETGDTNPNLPYDSSEALRIARGVDSLADLTYEASLEHNEFVKMWDKYINSIDNGASDPIGIQKFDIDTSLALVQFANILRENFIKIFEKSREARNALPVSQPITGRELRRCAYALSKMTPEEKATANPEVVARNLLDKYFLTHIDKKEEQDKIRTAMNTWTSKKRVRP
ncbi:MAG: AAA family ATPase [bacterium]|nr:AAA family ATPase [bacterium]